MLRASIIASLLVITAVIIKSNLPTDSDKAKPIKLSGFSISKVKKSTKAAAHLQKSKPLANRRTVATAKAAVATSKPPIESLAPEQKIERAKQAWENIRVKALDKLRIDQVTREELDSLREQYKKSADPLAYSDYYQNVKEAVGEENFTYLRNFRETFKSRVRDRAQIEIGPHLGVL